MLMPINSDPIVAVIIEATTTDHKSLARRLDVSKMAPSEIRSHSHSRDVCVCRCAHIQTRTYRSYTPLLVLSSRAVSPYAARPPIRVVLHNGLCIFSRHYRGKNSENTIDFRIILFDPSHPNI